jgi:cbb3-type cytochrome oxidase subunit 3
MKLGDVMSAMHMSLFAQIALIIAVAGFALVVVSIFLARNREPFRRASLLPLADDAPAGTPGGRA